MDDLELQKMVNPIYTTAKGTALMLAASGDKDAQAVIPYIGVEELYKNKKNDESDNFTNYYRVAQEARFEITNNAAFSSGIKNIVDLPCGYSPRGYKAANAGCRYYGFDLPIVIDVMKNAAEKTMSSVQKTLTDFCAVDATNYESMKNALKDVKGEICIVTEGLLGYFNESELESLCKGIYRLLSEYGGVWVTSDLAILDLIAFTFGALANVSVEEIQKKLHGHASRMADVEFYKNSLFTHGLEGAKEFLKKMGFSVFSESASEFLPKLRSASEDETSLLKNAYRNLEILNMRVGKKEGGVSMHEDLPFGVETAFNDGKLNMKIQGRMDTMTSPLVLKKFQDIKEKVNSIDVDVSGMSYVSSAGLRVLLIMYKSLEDKSLFKMNGVSPEVKDILELTGFDAFLLQ